MRDDEALIVVINNVQLYNSRFTPSWQGSRQLQ